MNNAKGSRYTVWDHAIGQSVEYVFNGSDWWEDFTIVVFKSGSGLKSREKSNAHTPLTPAEIKNLLQAQGAKMRTARSDISREIDKIEGCLMMLGK